MKRKIASTIIQLTIGPSKNFLSQIETGCVSSYLAYAIQELVPTWLRVPIWSGTVPLSRFEERGNHLAVAGEGRLFRSS